MGEYMNRLSSVFLFLILTVAPVIELTAQKEPNKFPPKNRVHLRLINPAERATARADAECLACVFGCIFFVSSMLPLVVMGYFAQK